MASFSLLYNKEIIKLNSNYKNAYFNKGDALIKIKRYQDALDCFNKTIELDSLDSDAYFNKGNALFYLNQQEDALEFYNKAIELNQNILNNEDYPLFSQGPLLFKL